MLARGSEKPGGSPAASSTCRRMPCRAALRADAHSWGVARSAYVTTCSSKPTEVNAEAQATSRREKRERERRDSRQTSITRSHVALPRALRGGSPRRGDAREDSVSVLANKRTRRAGKINLGGGGFVTGPGPPVTGWVPLQQKRGGWVGPADGRAVREGRWGWGGGGAASHVVLKKKDVKHSNRTASVHDVAATQLHFGRIHARGSFCPRQLCKFGL